MDYLYKATLLLSIFYLFYKIVLEKETFFQTNRWYLLLGLIFTTLLPLVVIPTYREVVIQAFATDFTTNSRVLHKETTSFTSRDVLWFAYWLGVFFFSLKYFVSLVSLFRLLYNESWRREGKYIFIDTKKNSSPFSFLNFIVINSNQFNTTELQGVIAHEKVHVNQFHTIDLLLINLIQIVLWFNPLVWLYKRALQQNLEYIADAAAQDEVSNPKAYQYLLLKTSTTIQPFAQRTNFYNSLIKKRIIMLQKNQSKKQNKLKYLLMLPLLGAFLFSFNRKEVINYVVEKPSKSAEITQSKSNADLVISITKNTSNSALTTYQKQFEEAGVIFNYSGIKRNKNGEITAIKLRLTNKDKSQQVSNAYAVSNGTISPVVLGIAHEKLFVKSLKDKGVTVINTTKKANNIAAKSQVTIIAKSNGEKPKNILYIVDGKEINAEEFKTIAMSSIKNIQVFKGDKAIEKYGEKGKNGVLVMSSKDDKVNLETIATTSEDVTKRVKHFFIIDGEKMNEENAERAVKKGIKSAKIVNDNKIVLITTNKDKGFITHNNKEYIYIINKDKLDFYNRYGEQVKDVKLLKVLQKKVTNGEKYKTVVNVANTNDKGFVSYKSKDYYYNITNGKLTFYTKYGEVVKDKKLLKKLKRML